MKILNFGSLNIDYTYRVSHIVQPGETISSESMQVFPGGKGLNQSIALARAGVSVWHAGMTGSDGRFLKEICEENGVNTEFIKEISTATGNAIIQVADDGQNSIILFPGANRQNTREYVAEVLGHFQEGDYLLLQNEINEVDFLISEGKARGMTVVLNPSPFDGHMANCDLTKVDLFFINEVEGEQMTGKKDDADICACMRKLYPGSETVLTLGEEGALWWNSTENIFQKAVPAKAVDTTAAGDTFTGYFLAAVMEGRSRKEALKRAATAASMSVEKQGASSSIPWKKDVDNKL